MMFYLFLQESSIWHFMRVVSTGDHFLEISKPVFLKNKKKKKKKKFNMSSAEIFPSMLSVNMNAYYTQQNNKMPSANNDVPE